LNPALEPAVPLFVGVSRSVAARAAAVVVSASLLAACDAAPVTPSSTPPPSGAAGLGGPSISMDESWQVLDGIWTFTGRVDPRDSPTSVVLDIGYVVSDPTSFEESIPVVDDVLEPGPVTATVPTPDEEWLCVRLRAENADGDAVTPRQCFPTDLPEFPPPEPSGAASPEPSGGPSPGPSGGPSPDPTSS
jgi:hypothetical protein